MSNFREWLREKESRELNESKINFKNAKYGKI